MDNNGTLTNFEKWRLYNDGLTSPDSFIDFAWVYMIMVCLQRRVWVGPIHHPIFANDYVILCGPPGVGKGIIIKPALEFLRHHKLKHPSEQRRDENMKAVDKAILDTISGMDFAQAQQQQEYEAMGNKAIQTEARTLFEIAPDSVTYEGLVTSMAKSIRRKSFHHEDGKVGVYTHSSMGFGLEELSSLFRRLMNDVVNFMLIAWDCGDYKKVTKTKGTDFIQKMCLSMLAGTTPEFMLKTFSEGLVGEGFSSRCLFIFETKKRKIQMFIPEHTDAQIQYKQDILAHIEKLSTLYGGVTYTPAAIDFLNNWAIQNEEERPNRNEKLLYYYERKKQHLQKVALALHFGESTDMVIDVGPCIRALQMLDAAELKMHHALVHKSDNPYYRIGTKIVQYLDENGWTSEDELLAFFWESLPTQDPREALNKVLFHYITIGRIVSSFRKGKSGYDVMRDKPPEEQKV